jgi:trigger factor
MQVQVSDAGQLRKRLAISYTPAEVAARNTQVLNKLATQVRLPGFRPGKSPKAVLAKRFGQEAEATTFRELADQAINQALRDHNLLPYGQISEEKPGDSPRTPAGGLALTVVFEVKPAITFPEPTALTIADPAVTVDEAEIETSLASLARRAGTEAPLGDDEPIQEDDGLTITGKILRDGVSVKDLHDYHHLVGGYPLLGKPAPEMVAILSGKKVGDAVRIETVLPAAFVPAVHANQPAVVEFTIQTARRMRPAAVDAALAVRFGYADLDGLRATVRTTQTTGKEDAKRRTQLDALIEQLLATVAIDLPPLAREQMVAQATAAASQQQNAATPAADIPAKVDADFRKFLLLDALVRHTQVQVSNQDLTDQILMAARQTGRKPEDIADQLRKSNQIQQVVGEIAQAKALETYLDRVLGRPVANPAHGETGHVHDADCNH